MCFWLLNFVFLNCEFLLIFMNNIVTSFIFRLIIGNSVMRNLTTAEKAQKKKQVHLSILHWQSRAKELLRK